MKTEISDAELIGGVEALVQSIFNFIDRTLADVSVEVRRAALEIFVCSAFERMTHEQRLELVSAMSSRWRMGVN